MKITFDLNDYEIDLLKSIMAVKHYRSMDKAIHCLFDGAFIGLDNFLVQINCNIKNTK